MLKVIIKGPVLSMSGYGEQARFLLSAIRHREDIDIYLINIPWGRCGEISSLDEESVWIKQLLGKTSAHHKQNQQPSYDVSIQITIPNEWENMANYNIGYTAGIETDRISPLWIQKSNNMNKIVTISEHSMTGFTKTKYEVANKQGEIVQILELETPIEVVGYSAREPENKEMIDLDLSTDFNFLAVSQFGPRKNFETLLRSFVKAFKDNPDVGLVVKTHTSNTTVLDKTRTKRILRKVLEKHADRKCKIYLLHGELSKDQMFSLYSHPKIHALATTTHGEGFGLPIFEAVCSGLPVIAPDWSGHRDFLYADTKIRKKSKSGKVTIKEKRKALFCKIPHKLEEVSRGAIWDTVIEKGSRWCSVDEKDVQISMKKVHKDYGVHKKNARILREKILESFSKEIMYSKMNSALFGEILGDDTEASNFNVNAVREAAMAIDDIKERSQFLKSEITKTNSQKEKLEVLHNIFQGKKCHILSCGPSLMNSNLEKLKDSLSDSVGIAIKQSYDIFTNLVDFHVYNCNNIKKYDYSSREPIIVEASSTPWKINDCDLKFFIKERDFQNSVSIKKNIDDWSLTKQGLLRPYGPGIMYEMVFYLVQHLGFSEVVTVGWDNKLVGDTPLDCHFYDLDKDLKTQGIKIEENKVSDNVSLDTLQYESKITTDCIGEWYDWLKSYNCEMKICSNINEAPSHIERVEYN